MRPLEDAPYIRWPSKISLQLHKAVGNTPYQTMHHFQVFLAVHKTLQTLNPRETNAQPPKV